MANIICGQTATPRLNFPALKITSELFLTSSYFPRTLRHLEKKWLEVIFSQKTKKKTSLAALYLADVLLDILIACLLNNNGQILLGDLRYDQ